MPRRSLVAIAALTLGLVASQAQAADKVTYILDWLPSGEETFPYIALHEGLFAKEGLDVTIAIGRGTSDVITKMSAGSAMFGSGGIGALMSAAVEHQVPVKAIASVFSKQPDAIMVVKGSPITSIKDLKGKTVATATFTSSNQLWPVVAKLNGLDPASVNLMKVDPAALGGLLGTGRVDAIIDWVTSGPDIAAAIKNADKQLVMLPWSASGLDGYGLSLFATNSVIKNQPDIAARFTRAYLAAVKISIDDCGRGAADMHAVLPEVETDVAKEQCDVTIPLIRNEISDKTGIGAFDPANLAATWGWIAKSQNYKPDQLNPETVVDRQFIPKGGA